MKPQQNVLGVLGDIALFSLGSAVIKIKELFEPIEDYSKTKVLLTILEGESGDAILSNVEVLAQKTDGAGQYEFLTASGRPLPLDLSDGFFRIIRHRVPR